jgi:hypothetical protein
MERIISIDHFVGRSDSDIPRAERLRNRRAAAERCARTGLLHLCAAVPPVAVHACCGA